MRITFVGQSTVLIESGEAALMIDPGWLNRVGPLFATSPDYRRAGRAVRSRSLDGILLTHLHVDHTEPRTLRALRGSLKPSAPLIFPALARPFLKRGRDRLTRLADFRSAQLIAFAELTTDLIERAKFLDAGQTTRIGPFKVTAVPMDHGMQVHGVAPVGCGFVIEAEGQVIYHTGDCILNEDVIAAVASACGRPDVMLVAIAYPQRPDRNHPQEAARLVAAVRPRAVVPMHFGMPYGEQENKPGTGVRKRGQPEDAISAAQNDAADKARRAALQRLDIGLALPGVLMPFAVGTVPEFAAALAASGSTAKLHDLDRLDTLDLDDLG